MLPNTPIEGATKIITRLQRSLTKKFFLDKNEQVLITFSAGCRTARQGRIAGIQPSPAPMRPCTSPNKRARTASVPRPTCPLQAHEHDECHACKAQNEDSMQFF